MPKKGFTLIELLVVIAIIGLLASVVLASLSTARTKANDAKREQDLHQLQTALALYYADNGSYPNPTSAGCAGNPAWSSWGCWTSLLASKYIAQVPKDPVNKDLGNCGGVQNCHIYEYCWLNNGQSYVLAVNLENAPPQSQGNPSAAGCSNGGPNWYWVNQ